MKNHKDSKKVLKKFLDINAPIYKNGTNGQLTIILPKKELKKMMTDSNNIFPKHIPIRIFKWRRKQ
jgi:hypothetical protein